MCAQLCKNLLQAAVLPCIKCCVSNTSVVPFKLHGRILTNKQKHSHDLGMFHFPTLRDMQNNVIKPAHSHAQNWIHHILLITNSFRSHVPP